MQLLKVDLCAVERCYDALRGLRKGKNLVASGCTYTVKCILLSLSYDSRVVLMELKIEL